MASGVFLSQAAVMALINLGVVSGTVDESGHLILTLAGGDTQDLGNIQDHGSLLGLSDDDHSQYALADGSRGDFASTAQGTKADAARPNLMSNTEISAGATNNIFELFTITDDGTDSSTWPNRWGFLWKDTSGSTPRNTTQVNEYGELRGAPAKHNTVWLRMFTVDNPGNTDGTRTSTVPVMELMDDRIHRNSLWGLLGDGTVVIKGTIKVAQTIVLGPSDSVPAGTPAGTVIVRTTS